MRLHVADHPLITHKLTQLRDRDTDSFTFRHLVDELVMLLAYESTRQLPLVPKDIVTPVAPTTGAQLATPGPLLVPILRAGLGMLNGMTQILPTAEVGFLGLVRDEETLQPSIYASRLPDDLTGRHVFLLDPMLATGGTLAAAMQVVHDRNAAEVTAVCLIAAPEGTTAVEAAADRLDLPITVVVGGMDERLNEVGYIVPGLGDAGDRLYGVV